MREIDAAEIKAQRRLELIVNNMFDDAEKYVAKEKKDLAVTPPGYYSFVTVLAVIAVSVVTSLATVMLYCEWHHLLK